MTFFNRPHQTRFTAVALLIGGAALFGTQITDSFAASRRPATRASDRTGGASAQQGQFGAFRFGANQIAGESLKTGGVRLILTGNAQLVGQGRTITAQQVSIDVPKGASDISLGRATGNVRMTMALEEGRTLTARGNNLIYRRDQNKIDLAGQVQVRSDLAEGGSVTATGNSAEVLVGPRTATLTGNVRLVLVKPDTISGPATITGPSMALDLRTGNWKIFGGRTQGSFNLKPQAGKQ